MDAPFKLPLHETEYDTVSTDDKSRPPIWRWEYVTGQEGDYIITAVNSHADLVRERDELAAKDRNWAHLYAVAEIHSDALRKQVEELRTALKGLSDEVESCARDCFARSSETFEADFKCEDPNGYEVWDKARAALRASEPKA